MAMVLWTKVQDTAPRTGVSDQAAYSNTKELGRLIYTQYVYAVEIAAVILLVAIVAAIALTLRTRKETKYQNPSQQINVRRADRVRILKIAPSPRDDARP
jgi:NADH-quinone oxidoreductase subunit J